MPEQTRVFTPLRQVFLTGAALGVAATLLFSFLFERHAGPTYFAARIQAGSKALLSNVRCVSVSDGSYLVSGFVDASPDSGVLKIGAFINFGNTGPLGGSNVQGSNFYTYFDTYDSAYGQEGGGALVFNVVVDNSSFGPESGGPSPKYCEAYVANTFR